MLLATASNESFKCVQQKIFYDCSDIEHDKEHRIDAARPVSYDFDGVALLGDHNQVICAGKVSLAWFVAFRPTNNKEPRLA